MFNNCRGFTLLEIVMILILVGLLSGIASSRLFSSASDLTAARDQLAAALSLGQQLAFARAGSSNTIDFSITNGRAIDLRENGQSINSHGLSFPINDFPNSVVFSDSTSTATRSNIAFRFNKMGEVELNQGDSATPSWQLATSAIDFSVSGGLTLRLEPSGFTHVP